MTLILPARRRQRGFFLNPYRFGGGGGGGTDPHFANVKFLWHADGGNGDIPPYTATVGGSVVRYQQDCTLSTATKVFGTASLYNGTSFGGLIATPGVGLSPGTGDFAIECWFSAGTAAASVYGALVEWRQGNSNSGVTLAINTTPALVAMINGAVQVTSSTLSLSTWYYAALSRVSGTSYLYVGTAGTASLVGSYSDSNSWAAHTAIRLTCGYTLGNGIFRGYLDDIRMTVGTGRGYTGSTISVPTAAFPDS